MALLTPKKKTTDSILSVFKKTVSELESHANSQHEEMAVIDHQITELAQRRKVAQDEAFRAGVAREKIEALLG